MYEEKKQVGGENVEDSKIIELYWMRDEDAIKETAEKYGSYLHTISYQIVSDIRDAEECVNETYNDAWNAMPPHRPSFLSTFLGKITRRISIDRWRKQNAQKRGKGEIIYALDELEECVSGKECVDREAEYKEIIKLINAFLASLPATERQVFLCRYWYMDSVFAIAKRFGFSKSKVTAMLHRMRTKLRAMLEKEGY